MGQITAAPGTIPVDHEDKLDGSANFDMDPESDTDAQAKFPSDVSGFVTDLNPEGSRPLTSPGRRWTILTLMIVAMFVDGMSWIPKGAYMGPCTAGLY